MNATYLACSEQGILESLVSQLLRQGTPRRRVQHLQMDVNSTQESPATPENATLALFLTVAASGT